MSRYYKLKVKLQAIKLYRLGKGSCSIARRLGVSRSVILRWVNLYNKGGKKALINKNRVINTLTKIDCVKIVLEQGLSCEQAALQYNIGRASLCRWVNQVRERGDYSVLNPKQKIKMGRPKKKKWDEMTEVERLRYENAYLKAELALLKKVETLVVEKKQLEKKTGLVPSKN